MKTIKYLTIILLPLIHITAQAQYTWEEVEIPDSIGIVDIAFNTNNEIFIATDHGPYYSQNGYQWEWLGIDDYPGTIYINDNNTIYLGSNDLYRSTDNGNNWDTLREVPNGGGINSIYSQDDINIYYGTWGGIYRSTDGGENWTEVLDLYNAEVINAIAENSQGKLFAGSTSFQGDLSPGGIYTSEDGGATWQLTGLNYHFVSSIIINTDDEIFVGTDGNWTMGTGRIYKSADNGQSWNMVFDNHYILSLSINEYDEVAAASETGIFCTYDGGQVWNNITPYWAGSYFKKVAFHPAGQLYAISHFTTAKLFRTLEPVIIPDNIVSQKEFKIYPNPANNLLFIETNNDIYDKVVISDITGKEIRRFDSHAKNPIRIYVGDLPPSVYIIQLFGGHISIKLKFIKR